MSESRREFIVRAWKETRKMWYPTVSETEHVGSMSAFVLGEALDFSSEYFLDENGNRSVRIMCEGVECERTRVPTEY